MESLAGYSQCYTLIADVFLYRQAIKKNLRRNVRMAKNVNGAFGFFNDDYVNLKPKRVTSARDSRDWLLDQIKLFPGKIDNFPILYNEKHIKFGSFARNTKIRPLDDIDLIVTFSAQGSTYTCIEQGKKYFLSVLDSVKDLKSLCNDNGFLNSIKVVNKIVSSLNQISQYSSAELHRNQEAATLKLSSYEWNFDIVPSFYTDQGFYLIPDGKGAWKASNPKIDQDRVSSINQKHSGNILQIIRTLKYWNRRASMSTIPSYLFETLILNYFNEKDEISDYIDVNLINFWGALVSQIYSVVNDPKGFQGDINTLSSEQCDSISERTKATYEKALEAYKIETEEKNQEKAINKWRNIFGNDFPKYE